MDLIYRQGNMFRIDITKLDKKFKSPEIINNLYIAIYEEFRGSIKNPKYKNLTYFQKMDKVNNFALNWLKNRGNDAKN